MNEVFSVLGLAVIGSFIGLMGGVVFLYNKRWSAWLSENSVPFAAGVLLTVALVGLLPEAVHSVGESAYIIVLLAFLGGYLFEHMFFDIHHHVGHTHNNFKSSVPLVIVGDTIHNFIDGVAIAASYYVSPGLGLITAVSTLLHEIPHEIGDFGILLKAGWKKTSVLYVNIASAATTLLGALFVIFFTQNENVIGILLAIAAGLFLYLGSSDFLPHVHGGKENSKKNVLYLLIGVAIMLVTFMAVPHSHGGEESDHHDHDHAHIDETSVVNDI